MNPNFDAYAYGVVLHVLPNERNRTVTPEPAFKPFDLAHLRGTPAECHRLNSLVTGNLHQETSALLAA
jgi:hypothetical protein